MDGVTFYQMDGRDYARAGSSLSGQRFREDRVFEGSRRSSRRFGQGNHLAGTVYRSAGNWRQYQLFCALKKRAIGLLKKGLSESAVLQALQVMVVQEEMAFSKKRRCWIRPLPGITMKTVLKKPAAVFDYPFLVTYPGIKEAIKSKIIFQYKRRRERYRPCGDTVRAG
jgi:hypothetical protein